MKRLERAYYRQDIPAQDNMDADFKDPEKMQKCLTPAVEDHEETNVTAIKMGL
jgi:hypothetical protein